MGGEEVPDPSSRAARSARRVVDALFSSDLASRRMGISIREITVGRAVVQMTVRDDMVNGHHVCHGGFIFALADSAFAFACNSHGEAAVAASASIDFLEPVGAGELLEATAVERVRRGRSGVYDVTVRTADGRVVAEFRGRSRGLGRPVRSER
ncbi:MAG: hydroxyphenylacetyl-CoA thioesterase PaaI [Acidothermus sp.]|nr:hydroxyphenylacetyl-CoA thioesterase PaaI [Acidothermus sp.]